MTTSEPTPVPAVNYKYVNGKGGQGGWAGWPTHDLDDFSDVYMPRNGTTHCGHCLGGTVPTIVRKFVGKVGSGFPHFAARATGSDVEENRLVLALHPDVKAVDRHFALGFLVGDERPAPVGWDQREDGIAVIGGLIWEIEARIDLPQHAAREDTEDNMWRLRLAVRPRNRSGLDRVEAEDAILVRRRTAEAHEPGVRPRT